MVVAAGRGCKVCSRPMIPSRDKRRTVCARPECHSEAKRQAGRKGARSLWGNRGKRKMKRCPQCGVTKPKTREHWSPGTYNADGSVRYWSTTCKPCTAALARDRYRTNPKLRERARRRAVRQRREGRGQRTGRGPRRGAHAGPSEDQDRMPWLDAAPLIALVERLAGERDLPEAEVCDVLGFDVRTLREWRNGRRAQWDVADRAVLEAGLQMGDLWPEVDSRPPLVVH